MTLTGYLSHSPHPPSYASHPYPSHYLPLPTPQTQIMFVLKPTGSTKTTAFTTVKEQGFFFAIHSAFFLSLRGAYAFFSSRIQA
jgi:hypothetical protein